MDRPIAAVDLPQANQIDANNDNANNHELAQDRLVVLQGMEQNYTPRLNYLLIRDNPNLNSLSEHRKYLHQMSSYLIEKLKYLPDVVSVSMSIFDRFIASYPENNVPPISLALLACTAPFTAIKTLQTTFISADEFASLSRGQFTAKDIKEAELTILQRIGWQINPPTINAYIRDMLIILQPSTIGEMLLQPTLNKQIEAIHTDPKYMLNHKSQLAYAAFLNAIDEVNKNHPNTFSLAQINQFTQTLNQTMNLHSNGHMIMIIRQSLLPPNMTT
jgi:hypothetical protein